MISPVVELRSNDPVESIDIGVAAIVSPVVPSCVKVASLSAPNDNTAESLIRDRSSPTNISAATPRPPPTVRAPVDAELEAVVFVTATTPVPAIVIALVSLAEPMLPASGMIIAPLPPLSVRTPVELSAIFSAATSDAAVLNDSLVAL